MHVGIIGAGWAGLACAVKAFQQGHQVTVLEASAHPGGRARSVAAPGFSCPLLDNGQHILIGAYEQSLSLMRLVGVDPAAVFLRHPMTLLLPNGIGFELPDWRTPWDLAGGLWNASHWTLGDKLSLVKAGLRWQFQQFRCAEHLKVADLCHELTEPVREGLIEPLCVSALNTPASRASASAFLRVLQDALLGGPGSSNYLLPLKELSELFPQPAMHWLASRGQQVVLKKRVHSIAPVVGHSSAQWQAGGQIFDQLVVATDATNAARILETSLHLSDPDTSRTLSEWASQAQSLVHESIGTVYMQFNPEVRLQRPVMALENGPAQFVFDRGQLTGSQGLLAFVISACTLSKEEAESRVKNQAWSQLGLRAIAVQAIVEKRATFACVPALHRPSTRIAPGLWACGDYIDGPYPSTLEGAVRSGIAVASSLPGS